ncbi:MAG: Rieske 2Fe-2S domain-containing protein [Draconibacterium sp.]|nr:Rieske 2Fe-2S domain-containing protein [Draconibacterium sp.]
MQKQNRRTFIRIIYAGIFALLVFVWNKLTLRHIKAQEAKNRVLPLNINKPVSFHDNYIVLNTEGNTRILSSHCTHLGCKINEVKNGRLICPCHGSEYDLNGVPLKGPAFKPLEEIPAKISKDQHTIELIV